MSNLQDADQQQIVVFSLEEPRYALFLSAVERVLRAVEITPLPKAPESILGVINLQGQIVPVVDVRRPFRLPACEVGPSDRFIIARTSSRRVALAVNTVEGVRQLGEREIVTAKRILPGAEYIRGVAKLEDGLILICDLDQFLSSAEEQTLDAALAESAKKRRKRGKTRNEEQPPR
jgi:purine-binding chemotaxis protein CheW